FEGERARIVGEQPAHAGRDFLDLAGREIERAVERDVLGHAFFESSVGSRRPPLHGLFARRKPGPRASSAGSARRPAESAAVAVTRAPMGFCCIGMKDAVPLVDMFIFRLLFW